MLQKIWNMNRWYDDLATNGKDGLRFGIFMAIIVPLILLTTIKTTVFAMCLAFLAMLILASIRIYWINIAAKTYKKVKK